MNRKPPTGPLYHPAKKNLKPPTGPLYHAVKKKDHLDQCNQPDNNPMVLFLKKEGKKKLFKDRKSKECSKCQEIKPHKDFNTTNGRLMYICKECQKIKDAIYMNKKKISVINEIYGGRFQKGCTDCNAGIIELPVLQFHHLNPNKKTTTWHKINSKNYREIISILENEKVRVICANCHLGINSSLFNEYKNLILSKDLFNNSPEIIDNIINEVLINHKRTRNKNSNYRGKIKRQIIFWVKKRYIIEKLYGGKCVACRKATVQKNLPSLQFHHTLRSKKVSEKWEDYSHLDVMKIVNILQKEKCVCLCANCHILIHSTRFEKHINLIHPKIEQEVKELFSKIKMNIYHQKFKSIEINDPFYKEFGFGDAWKKYLIQIGKLYGIYNPKSFTSKELAISLKITDRYLRRILKRLENEVFIEIVEESIMTSNGRTPIKYKLSEKGINTIQELN